MEFSGSQLHRECARLCTFRTWSIDHISRDELARTGFFYLANTYDLVQCFFFKILLGKWEQDDDVIKEHLRWSPKCPLLLREFTSNVPLNWRKLDAIIPAVTRIEGAKPTWDLNSTNVVVRQIHFMLEQISNDLQQLSL